MKKIVGILLAGALVVSAFAADVSAAVQGYGDLFTMEFKEGAKPSVLGWNDPWDREFAWYSTGIGLAATTEKAGVSFELDNRDLTVKNSKFWIKPIDMLKIQLGANTIGIPKETIDYAGTVFTSSYEGWFFELAPIDGLTFEAGLATGQKGGWQTYYWYNGDTMGEVLFSAKYNVEGIGSFKALYDLNEKKNTIALDYVGNFDSLMVSPAVAYKINDKILLADLYVTTNISGFGINVYSKVDVPVEAADTTAVLLNTKFSYGISLGTLSLQLKDENLLAKNFAMMAKLDLAFNCGSAGMNVGVQLDIAENVKVSVPFQYNLHF